MSNEAEHTATTVGIFVHVATGMAGLLTTTNSILSILLTMVSIMAGIMVIAVNWDKATMQFRKWMKKDILKNKNKRK